MEKYRHEFIDTNEMLDIHLEFSIGSGGSVINKHFHDWIEIVYLIRGDLEVQVNRTTTYLKQNDFIVIDPMSIHSTKCTHGNTAILLQIPLSFLERFTPDIRQYAFCVDLQSTDKKVQTKLGNIRSTLQELWIAYQFQTDGYIFRCYSLIFELIYILTHSFSHKVEKKQFEIHQRNRGRIEKIMDYVKRHYTEPVSISEISSLVGLNEIYFSRFFKSNMGVTFLEYLHTVRLEKIYVDILNTDLHVKDIQEKHGFYNEKVFRRMFRDAYGCSPGKVRKKEKQVDTKS